MRELATGGAGYIGSRTCIELLMAGHDVVVIDNFSNSNPIVFDHTERICGRRAERELGWKAQLDIEDMCRDAWSWQEKNPGGYEG